MRCRECPFRIPVPDTGLVDDRGNALPFFRCAFMKQFKPLMAEYCEYLFDTRGLMEDAQRMRLNLAQIETLESLMESLNALNSAVGTVSLTTDEHQLLCAKVQHLPNKQRFFERLTAITTTLQFRVTFAECTFFIDQLKAPPGTPDALLSNKFRTVLYTV